VVRCTCPVCGQFGRDATKPIEDMVKTGKLSWEFREYFVHGQPDFAPALLGRCGGPGPFFGLLEQMYVEQAPFGEKMTSPAGQEVFQRAQGQMVLISGEAGVGKSSRREEAVPYLKGMEATRGRQRFVFLMAISRKHPTFVDVGAPLL